MFLPDLLDIFRDSYSHVVTSVFAIIKKEYCAIGWFGFFVNVKWWSLSMP